MTESVLQVSVVMPAHNTAAYIGEAIASVLSQEAVAMELIVIDDGSQDDTAAVVQRLADPRIVLLRNAKGGGPARARNQGIRAARAPYVAFFDSDDVMSPGFLHSAIEQLDRQSSAVMVFGDMRRIDLQGKETIASVLANYSMFQQLPRTPLTDKWSLLRQKDFAEGLLHENFIGTCSVVVRRDVLLGTELFDEQLINSEDRDLWFRLSKLGDALYASEPVFSYRINPKSISHDRGERNARNRIEVLRRERKRWIDKRALRQIDYLIAENHASIGYTRRAQGKRLSSAACFVNAYLATPSSHLLKAMVGSLIGRRS